MFIRRTTKLKPRWLARVLAFVTGYFWLDCILCNKPFAGFESGGIYFFGETNPLYMIHGKMVCPDCKDKPGVF